MGWNCPNLRMDRNLILYYRYFTPVSKSFGEPSDLSNTNRSTLIDDGKCLATAKVSFLKLNSFSLRRPSKSCQPKIILTQINYSIISYLLSFSKSSNLKKNFAAAFGRKSNHVKRFSAIHSTINNVPKNWNCRKGAAYRQLPRYTNKAECMSLRPVNPPLLNRILAKERKHRTFLYCTKKILPPTLFRTCRFTSSFEIKINFAVNLTHLTNTRVVC